MPRTWNKAPGLALWPLLLLGGCDRQPPPQPAGTRPAAATAPTDAMWQLNNQGVANLERFDKPFETVGYDEAAKIFAEALRRWPDWNVAHFNLAVALINQQSDPEQQQQRFAQVEQLLGKLLEANPEDAKAHYTLGFLLKYNGRFDEARPHFAALCRRLAPRDAHSWIAWGDCLEAAGSQGPRDPADPTHLECYEKALQLNPYLAPAFYKLSMALRFAGQTERADALLARNQQLKAALNYQEYADAYLWSGPLMEAIGPPLPGPRPGERELPLFQFDPQFSFPLAPGVRWAAAADRQAAPHGELLVRARARWGAGLLAFDADADHDLDLLLLAAVVRQDQLGDVLFRNDGQGKFVDVTDLAGLAQPRSSLGGVVADIDCDGLNDLYLLALGGNRLFRCAGGLVFEDATSQALALADLVTPSAALLDIDHDSDLDLLVACYGPLTDEVRMFTHRPYTAGAPNAVFLNVGQARPNSADQLSLPPLVLRFQRVAAEPPWDAATATVQFAAADFDDDRDLDLVEINDHVPGRLLLNRRFGQWSAAALDLQAAPVGAYQGAVVADFNADTVVDLALLAASGARFLLNQRAPGADQPPRWSALRSDAGPLAQAQVCDVDGDGFWDLSAWHSGRPMLALNRARGMLARPDWLGARGPGEPGFQGLLLADWLGKAWPQVLLLADGQPPRVGRSDGNHNHLLALQLSGRRELTKDFDKKTLRTNPSAVGTRVIVNAGPLTTLWEHTTSHSGATVSRLPILVGLGPRGSADAVRLRWPDGVEQAELNLPAGAPARLEQIQRRDKSCPLLFTWNGRQFAYLTDFLGGGGIGYYAGPGPAAPPDPDEDLKIESHQLAPDQEGRYRLKIAEPMDELTYLDAAELEVIDHPPDVSVYPHERFRPSAPHPSGQRLAFRQVLAPLAARNERQQDVLAHLAAWDRQCVEGFDSLQAWTGYAVDHALELDFGTQLAGLGPGEPVALFLAGWVEYPYSQTNWAAAQAGLRLQPPALDWLDPQGQWQPLLSEMGYPAGLPRMMTLDLTRLLPEAVRDSRSPHPLRLRIRTNMEIYWDQVFAARLVPVSELVRTRLRPVEARLGYRGYVQEYSPDGRAPQLFDYHQPRAVPLVGLPGPRTPYGDVLPLVAAGDGQFALVNAGDELTLAYDARALPPLPPGWRRSFVFCAQGFCKDADLFNTAGPGLLPLPGRQP
jgi:Flp pilus assembly protein TadD